MIREGGVLPEVGMGQKRGLHANGGSVEQVQGWGRCNSRVSDGAGTTCRVGMCGTWLACYTWLAGLLAGKPHLLCDMLEVGRVDNVLGDAQKDG